MLDFRQSLLSRALGALALSACLTLGAAPSFAITAKDVTEKMSKQDRFNYLTGLIDMRAFVAAQAGDAVLPKCIYDLYYREKEGSAWTALLDALVKFPDKQPATIVFLLTQKACAQ